MVAIRVLPPEVVNRIAAGEVVERPASVVKELLENAIDSGADEIDLLVEDGGKKRIRIRDNGRGIGPDDLPLAFRSHATSKLPILDGPEAAEGLDLFMIETLGFRGEALASIAAVAELEVVSRTAGGECAYRYRPGLGGGTPLGPEPSAAPAGTTVEVLNLFGNTPARRKFLRAASTEFSHIVEQVMRLALGFPEIALTLRHGGRKALDLPRGGGLRRRLAALLGEEQAAVLIEVAAGGDPASGGARVHGLIGPPRVYRADARGQNFFVNGRWVRDRVLSHALREAYAGFQVPGRQPVAYLFVEVPRAEVDINVHPQKVEVRFRDPGGVHRALHRAVRNALERGDVGEGAGGAPTAECAAPASAREDLRQVEAATRDFFESPPRRPFGSDRTAGGRMASGTGADERPSVPLPAAPPPVAPRDVAPSGRPAAFQVLREFIIAERPEGLLLIDQHALHEKVLYERILRQLRELEVAAQRLLLPEVVRLPRELAPFIPRVIERLGAFGFELEPFGDCEIAIQAIPVLLDRGPAGEVVTAVAEWVRDNPRGDEESAEGVIGEARRRIAAMMACKQAVKAGMKLEPEEITSLLEESEQAADPRHCPHGRPTSVLLTREELEKRFDRR